MATQDKEFSQVQKINVVVSKAPILSPIFEEIDSGQTLRSIFLSYSGLSQDHTTISVNGEIVEDWEYITKSGDYVSISQVPAAPAIPYIVAAVVSTVIGAVAGYLLYQPPAGPTDSEKLNRIQGPRNEAKPYDPVPVVFGRRRINPAYAAEPYTEFRGADEYLSMLLCPAQGPVNISDIKIGDTPIDQYSDVQYDYVDGFSRKGYSRLLDVWNQGVVQEVINSELKYDDPPIVRSSAAGASRVTVEVIWPTGLRSNSESSGDAITVQYEDGGKWYAVVPKSVSNSELSVQNVQFYNDSYWLCGNLADARYGYAPTFGSSINIDSYFVNEYYDAAAGRTMAIFDADALLANNLRIGTIRAYAFTTDEFTRSFTFTPVDPTTLQKRTDAVQIRLQKAVPEYAGGGQRRRRADWFSLRSETPYTQTDFENAIGAFSDNGNFQPAIIALKIRASEQLNGVIDNLNCVVESVVPQNWSTDWSSIDPFSAAMKISDNPAEMYRWALQGNFNKIRTPDSKIDIATLSDWRDYCTLEGWKTSEYINYEETLRTVLGNVAFTGRADFSYRDGKFSVAQKIERTIPRQVFTPKNSSNLKSRREFPPNYDGIKFKFQNADREDQVDEGTYYDPYKFNNNDPTQPIPGADVTGIFRTVEFWGVTDPTLAQRHARFMFFENKLRREIYELDTDIEGLVASRGDLVRIAHDVIDVGIGQGFITQDSTSSTTFFMDEEKGAVVGSTYYFQVRQVNSGVIFTEFSATYQGGGEWLADTAQTLNRGDLAVYGEQGKESLDCIIIGVQNDTDYNVKLTLVNAAPEIYDEDAVTLPTYTTGLTPRMDYLAPLPPIVLTSQSEYAYTTQTLSVFVKADNSQSITGGAVDWFTLEYRVDPETIDPDAVTEDESIVWLKAGTIPSTENRFEIPVETGYGRRYQVRAKALNGNLASAYSDIVTIVVSDSPAATVDDFTIVESVNEPKTPDARWSTLTITIDPPADENYLYSIVEYKQPGQDQYLFVGKVGWENPNQATIQVYADGRQYDIRVRSVSVFGVESPLGLSKIFTTTNTEDPEYTADNPFKEMPAPNVSGLELLEQGNNTVFTGKHAKFTWRKSTLNDWIAIGYTGLKGASGSQLDQYFRDYWVTITADNKVVREEGVVDNFYTYTYEKNAEDYERRYGVPGAYREFSIAVYMRTRQNQRSEKTARLNVSNTAPSPLSNLNVVAGFSNIEISYDRPVDLDFAGVDIWVSTVQGFDPDTTTPTATVSDNSYMVAGLADNTTYYVRLRPFDLFGKTDTNTSSEFTVITKDASDLTGLSGWAYELDPADEAFIEENLASDAIPSTKIKNLTAAKITTGTLLATETVTSEGLIRSVDDINNPQWQTGIGPLLLNDDGQGGTTPTTYLMWGYSAAAPDGEKLRFGIDELGNAYFRGNLTASSFNNDNLTIDELGNVTSTGTFRFGGATSDYVEFDGTNLIIDTPEFSVDGLGNATFSGQLSAATGVFGDESTGEYIKYENGIFEVGPNATIGSNANRTVTVGTGGDFASINEALEYLSRTVPAYVSGGFEAEILVLDNHTETEPVNIVGLNLGWVTITKETLSIPLNVNISTSGSYFTVSDYSVGPILNLSISGSGIGTSENDALIKVTNGSSISLGDLSGYFNSTAGARRSFSGARNIVICSYNSNILSNGNKFTSNTTSSGTGGVVKVSNGSSFSDLHCLIENGYYGIEVLYGCIINIDESEFSNSGFRSIYSINSTISAYNCNFNGLDVDLHRSNAQIGSRSSTYLGRLFVSQNSAVDARLASFNGTSPQVVCEFGSFVTVSGSPSTNIEINTFTSNGAIFQ